MTGKKSKKRERGTESALCAKEVLRSLGINESMKLSRGEEDWLKSQGKEISSRGSSTRRGGYFRKKKCDGGVNSC